MKRIHLWVAAIVAVATLSLPGCRKDKDSVSPRPENKTKIYLPVKISSSNSSTTYTYYNNYPDSTGLIQNIIKTDGNNIYKYELIHPTVPRQLHYFVNGELKNETIYAFDANRMVTRGDIYISSNYWEDLILVAYFTLSYNSSNKLSQVSYFKENGDKEFDEFFEYSPDGNISKITHSGIINFEYDNLNGMGKSVENAYLFYIQGADYMLFYNQNNLTKVNESTRSYQFNDDKYPTEMTIKNGDSTSVYAIEYLVR